MFYYITDETIPTETILLYRQIDGFRRAKNLWSALIQEEPNRSFVIHITKTGYMWGIEGEPYHNELTYYIFDLWDEAAEFGYANFTNFDTDTDIVEINMM